MDLASKKPYARKALLQNRPHPTSCWHFRWSDENLYSALSCILQVWVMSYESRLMSHDSWVMTHDSWLMTHLVSHDMLEKYLIFFRTSSDTYSAHVKRNNAFSSCQLLWVSFCLQTCMNGSRTPHMNASRTTQCIHASPPWLFLQTWYTQTSLCRQTSKIPCVSVTLQLQNKSKYWKWRCRKK